MSIEASELSTKISEFWTEINNSSWFVRKLYHTNGFAGMNLYATLRPSNWGTVVRTWRNDVKNRIGRLNHNFGKVDVWEFHYQNAKAQVHALTELLNIAHGYPVELDNVQPEDLITGSSAGFERWQDILKIMIDGWQAILDEEDNHIENGDYVLYRERSGNNMERFRKGMELYVKYYQSLWD